MAYQQASAAPLSSKNCIPSEIFRRPVTYHPTIWGDHFLTYTSDLTEISSHEEEQLEKQKEEVRKLLDATEDDSVHKMEMIDAIQRLGVGYHFEKEIDNYLQYILHHQIATIGKLGNDLHKVALRFLLLRQNGYYVSSDVFNDFKDHTGKFAESLISDVKGTLTLYEAAHFGLNGEDILDEALEFCSTHLKSIVGYVSNSLATQINEALNMPLHKSLNRLEARKFMSIYQQEEDHSEILLKFAKLDFNLLQKMHQKELRGITRWWKDLDFANKLPFARDRVVECYFWILSVYLEPQYSLARRILTKVIAMTSVIDDIYDVYGAFDDLQLFTDAIQRWELCALETLPPYMRICYQALLDVYAEIEDDMEILGTSYRVHYAKEEMKKLARAYFEEAKWLYTTSYLPNMEEYMKVTLISGAYMMLATTSLVGMESLVTKETFEWVSNEPLIVRASSVICRLMDDMVGYGIESKFTAVECYMNENDALKEEAFGEFRKQVEKAWKDINEECIHPTAVPVSVLMRILNLSRVINLLYSEEDGYNNSKTKAKDIIISVLVEPIS
ncbi:(-)-germacrene D synthase [Handroanthus impetiginosus]|uniref:(-)-germacrene D synthase n=1 Tax=Handroanthus impetiginosus TaxID=429701 RepID=A0A2G9HAL6_9LAMI|nr:(-)-germacrene D synthase [Handroanthus impetiginosus]